MSLTKNATATNSIDPNPSDEGYARSVNSNVILFIAADGHWEIGLLGQKLSLYQNISFLGNSNINDTTYGVKAIDLLSNKDGSYDLFGVNVQGQYFQVTLSNSGAVLSASPLNAGQLFAFEKTFNVDINRDGIIGDATVPFVSTGNTSILKDGSANLYLQATGTIGSVQMNLFGQALSIDQLKAGGFNILGVVYTGNGSSGGPEYDVYIAQPSASSTNYLQAVFSTNGNFQSISSLTLAQLKTFTNSTGYDFLHTQSFAIPTGWQSTLSNPYIQSDITSLTNNASHTLSISGAVSLINDLVAHVAKEANGLSVGEYNDLQAICAHSASLMSSSSITGTQNNYLQTVFSYLVNPTPANTYYTGGQNSSTLLGNLTVGSTASQIQLLENKWLLGSDNPSPFTEGDTANPNSNPSVNTYSDFSASNLFSSQLAPPSSTHQGGMGDCYLIACVLSVFNQNPNLIKTLIVDNGTLGGSETYGIEFFDANSNPIWVTVNAQLPVSPDNIKTPVYANSPNDDIWLGLLEKAFVEAQGDNLINGNGNGAVNTYANIEGGTSDTVQTLTNILPTNVWDLLTQTNPKNYDSTDANLTALTSVLTKALNAGNIGLLGSNVDSVDPNTGVALVASVSDSNKLTVTKVANGGQLSIGDTITGNNLPSGTIITGFISGTNGGVGVYSISNSTTPIPANVSSEDMQDGAATMLVSGHEMYLVSAAPNNPNNNLVKVYNPWGLSLPSSNNFESPFTMTVAQLVGLEIPAGGDISVLMLSA